ncbi:hypothetical protein ABTM90_19700, partial [Acinetobacter baumannii]
RLADDEALRRGLGANGRLRAVDRWDRKTMLLQFESRVHDLCSGTASRGRHEIKATPTTSAPKEEMRVS